MKASCTQLEHSFSRQCRCNANRKCQTSIDSCNPIIKIWCLLLCHQYICSVYIYFVLRHSHAIGQSFCTSSLLSKPRKTCSYKFAISINISLAAGEILEDLSRAQNYPESRLDQGKALCAPKNATNCFLEVPCTRSK